jgi:hypothetical protein
VKPTGSTPRQHQFDWNQKTEPCPRPCHNSCRRSEFRQGDIFCQTAPTRGGKVRKRSVSAFSKWGMPHMCGDSGRGMPHPIRTRAPDSPLPAWSDQTEDPAETTVPKRKRAELPLVCPSPKATLLDRLPWACLLLFYRVHE